MSLNVTFNGSMYIIPETGEVGWGGNTTSYLVAIAAGALQKTGGSFTLSSEIDFGASFGIMSLYYKSRSANVAAAGILRLNNNSDSINFRNFANSADLPLMVNASNELLYNGNQVLTGAGPSSYVSSITGTANQVIASASTGPVTLSLPQSINSAANVQFGTLGLGSSIVASSILSLTSSALGFLPPRMTTAQRDAIVSPATALFVFNTDTNVYNYYNGAVWVAIAAGGTINAGLAGFFSYYPANGTTLDDQALLSTDLTNISLSSGQYLSPTGSAVTPTYSFTGDANTGMYLIGADTLGFAVAGVLAWQINPTGDFAILGGSDNRILSSAGTAALPAYSFNVAGSSDAGMYASATGALDFSTAGVNRLSLNSSNLQTSLHVIPSANNTLDLGTTALAWRDLYLGTSIKSGVTTLATITELGYLTGVTSAIQTQLNTKATDTLVVHLAGTETITGQKTFNLPVLGPTGTAAAPTFASASFPTSGFSINSAGNLLIGVGGVTQLDVSSGLFEPDSNGLVALGASANGFSRIFMNDGSAASPSYTFSGDTNTGIYRIDADRFAFATAGIARWQVTADGVFAIIGGQDEQLLAGQGTAAAPAYSFNVSGATADGMYGTSGGGLLQFAVGGSRIGYFAPSLFSLDTGVVINATDGSSTAPTYSFFNDPDSGMYRLASNTLAWVVGGGANRTLSLSTTNFEPFGAGTVSTGNATNYWNDISYKTLTDRGCLPWCDDGVELCDGRRVSDLEALCSIEKHPTEVTIQGLPKLNYATFPKKAYVPAALEGGELLPRDENDLPIGGSDGIEMTMMFGVMIGAFKQLKAENDALKARLDALENK